MHNNKQLRLLAAVAVLYVCRIGWGQTETEFSVRGEVHAGGVGILGGAVALIDARTQRTVASANLLGDGTFEIHVAAGMYTLAVLQNGVQTIYQESVSIYGANQLLEVRIPQREMLGPARTVSARELLHPPSKKAVEAFAAARKFSDTGAYEKAAEQLQKAVEISPEYVGAWVNLAAQHIRLSQYQTALDELARATAIGGESAVILGDAAFAEHGLHHDDEAMLAARRALQIDPEYPQAHYLLGVFLSRDRRTLPEAVSHLEIAARTLMAVRPSLEEARAVLRQTVSHP